jgi:autoinducer 2-degrading protein
LRAEFNTLVSIGSIAVPKPAIATAAAIMLAAASVTFVPARSQGEAAPSAPLYIYAVDLDIVAADFDKFMLALKENAVASMQDPGCREFDVAVSQKDPHHVFLFEVYDDAAALRAHEATEHFKKYSAVTADMVIERHTKVLSAVAMHKHGA